MKLKIDYIGNLESTLEIRIDILYSAIFSWISKNYEVGIGATSEFPLQIQPSYFCAAHISLFISPKPNLNER